MVSCKISLRIMHRTEAPDVYPARMLPACHASSRISAPQAAISLHPRQPSPSTSTTPDLRIKQNVHHPPTRSTSLVTTSRTHSVSPLMCQARPIGSQRPIFLTNNTPTTHRSLSTLLGTALALPPAIVTCSTPPTAAHRRVPCPLPDPSGASGVWCTRWDGWTAVLGWGAYTWHAVAGERGLRV